MCSSFAVETPEIKSGRSSDMENLNIKAELYPYVFMSEN